MATPWESLSTSTDVVAAASHLFGTNGERIPYLTGTPTGAFTAALLTRVREPQDLLAVRQVIAAVQAKLAVMDVTSRFPHLPGGEG